MRALSFFADGRNHLNFDDTGVRKQFGGSHRCPRRLGTMHELFLDLLECLELISACARKVRALPNVEAVDHRDIVKVQAGSLKISFQSFKCPSRLRLEGFHIGPLLGTATHDDRR